MEVREKIEENAGLSLESLEILLRALHSVHCLSTPEGLVSSGSACEADPQRVDWWVDNMFTYKTHRDKIIGC